MPCSILSVVTGLPLSASLLQLLVAAILIAGFSWNGIGGCKCSFHSPGIPGFSAPPRS